MTPTLNFRKTGAPQKLKQPPAATINVQRETHRRQRGTEFETSFLRNQDDLMRVESKPAKVKPQTGKNPTKVHQRTPFATPFLRVEDDAVRTGSDAAKKKQTMT